MEAALLRELCLPAHLKGIVNMPRVSEVGAKLYVETFVKDAAPGGDPVEVLLLQQLLLLHFRLARLHQHASGAESLEVTRIVNGAAARLTGEMRRMALALKAYRAPVPAKSVNFIKMQAVAERQAVQYVDHGHSSEQRIVSSSRSELEAEPSNGGGYGGRFADQAEGPGEGGCRQEPAAVGA